MKRNFLSILLLQLLLLPTPTEAQESAATSSVILDDTYYCGDHLTRNALDGTATYYFDNGYIQIPPQNQMEQPQYYYYTRDHLGSVRRAAAPLLLYSIEICYCSKEFGSFFSAHRAAGRHFVRTIMGKSLRKADERHNKTVTKGDGSIWEK